MQLLLDIQSSHLHSTLRVHIYNLFQTKNKGKMMMKSYKLRLRFVPFPHPVPFNAFSISLPYEVQGRQWPTFRVFLAYLCEDI